jgi:hypothetical protein
VVYIEKQNNPEENLELFATNGRDCLISVSVLIKLTGALVEEQ